MQWIIYCKCSSLQLYSFLDKNLEYVLMYPEKSWRLYRYVTNEIGSHVLINESVNFSLSK